ncbi:conserved hypothetical protein [Aliiglaciecola lipolytica E3]|uniref:RelA/SpoT domain-containing protein n=2 Tax=Aliiglaciecola TaxID=1406885 RepID=K6XQR3_9ALTE|nr:conserved hypothetical protein [Aliiglaciecola lipolytica E3]
MDAIYSGKAITKAGEKLIADDVLKDNQEFSNAMDVLSYWRHTFEAPLETAFDVVEKEAQAYDKQAICAKRLKRHVSIVNKLRRFEKMKLRNMQDIGGCRVIVSSIKKLRQIERRLKKRSEFRIRGGQVKMKDYINHPKEDGYRSVHLIGQFNDGKGGKKYIEIQLRTVVQHYWATSLEIVDLFTHQSLKTNQGEEVWKSFFRDAGALFEVIDNIHLFSQLDHKSQFEKMYEHIFQHPDKKAREHMLACCKRVVKSCRDLKIINKLEAYTGSLKVVDDRLNDERIRGYVLLEINMKQKKVQTTVFEEENAQKAAQVYVAAEKHAAVTEDAVVALVFSNAVGGIKSAYPNYFADSSEFIRCLLYIRRIYEAYDSEKSFSTSVLKTLFGVKQKN